MKYLLLFLLIIPGVSAVVQQSTEHNRYFLFFSVILLALSVYFLVKTNKMKGELRRLKKQH